MDKQLLYWLFSTIVQAFVALLALVGVVGIYRLSDLNRLFERLEDKIKHIYGKNFDIERPELSPDLLIKELFVKAVNRIDLSTYDCIQSWRDRFSMFKTYLNLCYREEKILKKYFIAFAIVTIIVIIWSLISLRYTPRLTEVKQISLIIGCVIGLSLLSLLLSLLLIKRALMPKVSQKKIIKYLSSSPS